MASKKKTGADAAPSEPIVHPPSSRSEREAMRRALFGMTEAERKAREEAGAAVDTLYFRWDTSAKKPRRKAQDEPKEATAPAAPDTYYPAMPLELIDPSPDNPRQALGDLAELAASMAGPAGVVQPLLLTPRGDRFLTVVGHRRRAAAALAKLEAVPALVREMNEATRRTIMLVENLQREDLTPLEEARAYASLVDLGWSQRRIAHDVGRGQPHIHKRLSLLTLPPPVLKRIDSGGITVTDALELVKLVPYPERLERAAQMPMIAAAVGREIHDIDEGRALEQRARDLTARGQRVITSINPHWFVGPEEVDCIKLGNGWQELPLDPDVHEGEPCHAVGILSARPEDSIPLCTDRGRHPDVFTAAETQAQGAAPSEDAARINEVRAQDRKDDERREAFVLDLLTARAKDARGAMSFAAHAFVALEEELGDGTILERIAMRLGVWAEGTEDGPAESLHGYIDRAKAELVVQFLCVLPALSCDQVASHRTWHFLAAQGYELSERERARLQES